MYIIYGHRALVCLVVRSCCSCQVCFINRGFCMVYKMMMMIMNFLLDTMVSANSLDIFKNWLDQFWQDQEVQFNWKADVST